MTGDNNARVMASKDWMTARPPWEGDLGESFCLVCVAAEKQSGGDGRYAGRKTAGATGESTRWKSNEASTTSNSDWRETIIALEPRRMSCK